MSLRVVGETAAADSMGPVRVPTMAAAEAAAAIRRSIKMQACATAGAGRPLRTLTTMMMRRRTALAGFGDAHACGPCCRAADSAGAVRDTQALLKLATSEALNVCLARLLASADPHWQGDATTTVDNARKAAYHLRP